MPLSLPPRARQAFDRLAADLGRVFASRLEAVVAYGEHTGLVFASSITGDDLDALATLVPTWHREGLATPLVMTSDEFRRSLSAFPLEYQAILDRHLVIVGTTPLLDAQIPASELRRACEIQAKGHLIHLRQGWMDCHGHADRLADLVVRSAPPFHLLLANVARLSGRAGETRDDLVAVARDVAGLPADLVREVLTLETDPHEGKQVARRLREYVAAAEHLWTFVDGWVTA